MCLVVGYPPFLQLPQLTLGRPCSPGVLLAAPEEGLGPLTPLKPGGGAAASNDAGYHRIIDYLTSGSFGRIRVATCCASSQMSLWLRTCLIKSCRDAWLQMQRVSPPRTLKSGRETVQDGPSMMYDVFDVGYVSAAYPSAGWSVVVPGPIDLCEL